MKFRVCTKCNKNKEILEFHFRKDSKKYRNQCKKCVNKRTVQYVRKNKEKINKRRKEYRKKVPWKTTYDRVKQRCNNTKATGYKDYGGRGIKCLITEHEIKKLWFRDKAYLLKKPSIDREDNDGNYTYDNCRFIELGENSNRNKKKSILQYDKQGNFIREWKSAADAGKQLNKCKIAISMCANKKQKTSAGFIWRYKK